MNPTLLRTWSIGLTTSPVYVHPVSEHAPIINIADIPGENDDIGISAIITRLLETGLDEINPPFQINDTVRWIEPIPDNLVLTNPSTCFSFHPKEVKRPGVRVLKTQYSRTLCSFSSPTMPGRPRDTFYTVAGHMVAVRHPRDTRWMWVRAVFLEKVPE